MERREFLTGLLGTGLMVAASSVPAAPRRLVAPVPEVLPLFLQECFIAGSAHYEVDALLHRLCPGDRLQLKAESSNPHDAKAVEAFWRSHKLGYVPRRDNVAVASLLARGHKVYAEVTAVFDVSEAWEPLLMQIYVPMEAV